MEIVRKVDKYNREIEQMMSRKFLHVFVMECSMIDGDEFEMDSHLGATRVK